MDRRHNGDRIPHGSRGTRGTRGTRPGAGSWEVEMERLGRTYDQGLCLPDDTIANAARRLDVASDTVARRFAEYSRRMERDVRSEVDARLIAIACRTIDFAAAQGYLRSRGVDTPPPIIERLLRVAPGPDASRLRHREAERRLALRAPALRSAA